PGIRGNFIIFNGALKTGCTIQFEDMAQERHVFKLDETGNVALVLPQGKNTLRKIICSDVGPYTYMFSNNSFVNVGDGNITYFGKIEIDWKVDGGFKSSLLFGAIGAALDASKESSEGSAVMRLQTREPASSVVRDFVTLNGKIKRSKFKKGLLELRGE
ncbi:MAG TPA: hypothetical protein DCY86_17905, partial [Bdellovibrionales bacterium]|nr:hypothetical protein [Bdellovibrionales bacterium]